MRKPELKTKLTAADLDILYGLYNVVEGTYKPQDAHQQLLLVHASELRHRLFKMTFSFQDKYKLKLNSAEALAFAQLWNQIGTNPMTLSHGLISRIITEIDKASKTAKIQSNANK